MQPSLSLSPAVELPAPSVEAEPVIEVLEGLVSPQLHAAAWLKCSAKEWYFGHGSNTGDGTQFWKMDLDGDAAFGAIWEQARPRCEALAGTPLRVIRVYANGHTYGLGGKPHLDDNKPGTFTLLYYPNPEWKAGWDGETVFYDQAGEIALSVTPRPNRAVFFDSRIPHSGRAPGRHCTALRVTVAWKLEVAGPNGISPERPAERPAESAIDIAEISREGAQRIYRARVRGPYIEQAVRNRLAELEKSVRLPGFRAGHIPPKLLEERYGAQARAEVLRRAGGEILERGLPAGSVPGSCGLSGDAEFRIAATHLPDLPAVDFSQVVLESLTADQDTLQSARMAPEAAAALFRGLLKQQVLDRLDAAYTFAVLPELVAREFSLIRKAAGPAATPETEAELRAIAERRLRLGLLVNEMARRLDLHAETGAELEDRVIDRFIAQAQVQERRVTAEELEGLAGE
jgi:SM-20-related protein